MVRKRRPAKTISNTSTNLPSENVGVEKSSSPAARRDIPGSLPYSSLAVHLKIALDGLIEAQRPDKFNADFLENVLKLKGGSAKATIPILKKMGFLASDSTPTELYAKFRTESGRGTAALQGLRSAFREIFRRSEYAHSVDTAKLKDIIVEITGLKPNDQVAGAIRSTFNVIKSYVPPNTNVNSSIEEVVRSDDDAQQKPSSHTIAHERKAGDIRLAGNINIVLPETSDLNVLNAIFRSIKENLM